MWQGAQSFEAAGIPGSASIGTTITAPGSANTKGAWTTILASTARDCAGLMVSAQFNASSGTGFALADIGIGAAGSEVVVVPNVLIGRISSNPYASTPTFLPLPLIPAGTRVAVRYQTDNTGGAVLTAAATLAAPTADYPLRVGAVSDLGTATASSKGTQIDPGTTANTKGAYAQLVASAAHDAKWAVLSLAHDAPVDFGYAWRVDIAVGAASSEVVVVPDLTFHSSSAGGLGCVRASFPLSVKAGERVAIRAQSSATNGSRVLTGILHIFG